MSKINVDTWEPESGTALTMGASGDTTTVPSGASLVVASGATINITGATQTGFPSAGFHQLVVRSSTGSATYSPASGVTKLIVIVQGAGGGGAGGTFAYSSSSGSAGGYALKFLTGVASTDVMTVVVGAAGAGATGAAAGVAGGASQFVSVSGGLHPFTTVEGLGGGKGNANTVADAGGVASGGDINIDGILAWGASNPSLGSNSMFGFGGTRQNLTATGNAYSVGYGAGGIGGYSVADAQGRAGRDGLVMIWEYK